jgi:hypothetical protein
MMQTKQIKITLIHQQMFGPVLEIPLPHLISTRGTLLHNSGATCHLVQKFMNSWSFTSTPPYAFMSLCLDSFTSERYQNISEAKS